MKKTLFTLALVLVAFALNAQQPKDDLPTLLKKAGDAAKANNYNEAMVLINQAKTETNRLIGEQYLAALPTKYGDWVIVDASKMMMGTGGMPSGGGQSYTRAYTKPVKAAPADTAKKQDAPGAGSGGGRPGMSGSYSPEPRLDVTITKNISQVTQILSAHNVTDENTPSNNISQPVKIKGYKAVQSFQGNIGQVSVLLGSTVIEVRGNNITSVDDITKFIDAVDLAKIKTLGGD